MKLVSSAYLLLTAGSLVAASPSHRHHHAHVLKREPNNVEIVTINEYVVNGVSLSLEEVCQGIASGTLRLSDGSTNLTDCQAYNENQKPQVAEPKSAAPEVIASSASSDAPVKATSSAAPEVAQFTQTPAKIPSASSSSAPVASKEAPPAAKETPPAAKDSPPAPKEAHPVSKETQAPAPVNYQPTGQGLDREFPSNTIDCSTFPSDYGPISIDWQELGGWSGIQYVTFSGSVITGVVTGIKGDQCKIGAMCSYACPPGWQKTQWPTVPPAEGRSVGGLYCNSNNKLELTNPNFSKTLCMQGTGATRVENLLTLDAMICRTDYPGTEGQTVPLRTRPGQISELTCPDSSRYYRHEGLSTTAQYYINNKGVPKEEACQWNQDGSHEGNWAPSILGVGRDTFGKTWLSIFTTIDNKPIDYQPLDYAVEIASEGNGQLSGKCCLKNGQYCFTDISGATTCNQQGCTVELVTGTAKFVLTDS